MARPESYLPLVCLAMVKANSLRWYPQIRHVNERLQYNVKANAKTARLQHSHVRRLPSAEAVDRILHPFRRR